MNDEQPAVDPKQNLERPARKQVPGPVKHENNSQHLSGSSNIWSGRQIGPRSEGRKAERRHQPSAYRCKPTLDAGRTKGSQGDVNTFCLFFAKGMCYQGPDCPYLHRLPTSADNAAMARTISMDIFGREKMPDGLDNRKGAGSYDRDMTTLYVHYAGAGHYAVPQLRHLLLQDFGEFGPVRGIHIVPAKTIAFVKYHWRVSAEFAREAMDQQSLKGSTLHEVLSVRWATDDPNPVAVVGRKRAALDAVEAAAMSAWDALPPEEKRARIAMAQQARAQRVTAVASALPEPLMAASATGGSIPDDSFDAWRGFGSDEQQHSQPPWTAGADTAEHASGSAAVADAGSGREQCWVNEGGEGQQQAGSDPQADAAQWQAYSQYAAQQQQQQHTEAVGHPAAGQGQSGARAWFQGWRHRQKPEAASELQEHRAEGDAAQTMSASAGGAAAEQGGEGVLGLLAGYGSESEEA